MTDKVQLRKLYRENIKGHITFFFIYDVDQNQGLGLITCCVLNEMSPSNHMCLVLNWWFSLGKLRKCGFVGGNKSTGAGFKISKLRLIPSILFLLPDCGSRNLSDVSPVTSFPSVMVDTYPSGTIIPNKLFCMLSWPQCS